MQPGTSTSAWLSRPDEREVPRRYAAPAGGLAFSPPPTDAGIEQTIRRVAGSFAAQPTISAASVASFATPARRVTAEGPTDAATASLATRDNEFRFPADPTTSAVTDNVDVLSALAQRPIDERAEIGVLWQTLLQQLDEKRFDFWFRGKVGLQLSADQFIIAASSEFLLDGVQRLFRKLLCKTVADCVRRPVQCRWVVDREIVAAAWQDGQLTIPLTSQPHTTFDSSKTPEIAETVASGIAPGFDQRSEAPPNRSRVRHNSSESTAPTISSSASFCDAIPRSLFTDQEPPTSDFQASTSPKPSATAPLTANPSSPQRGPHELNEPPVTPPTLATQGPSPKTTGQGAIRATATASPQPGRPTAESGNQSPRQRRLSDFADFGVTAANEMAVSACRQVGEGRAPEFNPLFLHGPVGCGKTHLLEAISRELRRTRPHWTILSMTAEAFANSFSRALAEKSQVSFRQRFRHVDVLLIDDVDFLTGMRVIRAEFLHSLRELMDQGRMVVLTSDRHPRLLSQLGEELVSRFMSGLVCRLEYPDLATRRLIIEQKLTRRQFALHDEIIRDLSQRFQGNVRSLEGAINCLQTYAQLKQQQLTPAIARDLLNDLERDCRKTVRLTDIEYVVASAFGLTVKEMKSASRARSICQPRMLAMFLARKHTRAAYSEIGQHFGGRDHTTVMAAERKVQSWIAGQTEIRLHSQVWSCLELLQTLEQQLLAG